MTTFHASIRNVLAEIDSFFSETLRSEKVSKKASLHKEKILDLIFRLRQEYPELLPKDAEFTRNNEDFIPELAARELRNITKAGFLEKRRKKAQNLFQRGSYQRRYCVIQNGVFYYYVHPTDKKQAGAFRLKGYKFRKAPYLPDDGNKKDLSFELVCPGKRSFQFLAEISQDFKEWKEAVEKEPDDAKKDNKSKSTTNTNNDRDGYIDDDDYYVAVDSDDDRLNPPADDANSSDGENYEVVSSPAKPEPQNNGNHNTDKPKPPLPKKTVPKPPKQSVSKRAPLKPPAPPKHDRALKEIRGDGDEYVDCESRRTNDDDDDDDNDYTEPIDFGRYSDGDFEDDLEPMNNKKGEKGYKKPLEQTDSQDLYYADATSAPPRSSASSDIYQDASSGGARK